MSLLFQRQVEEEEEEEDPGEWAIPNMGCASCGETLHYTEEIFHISVCYAVNNGTETIIAPYICDEGEFEGDYYYEPLFFEFSCWEDVMEELREMVDDAPPVNHKDELLACDFCKCSICEFENFATAYIGEVHVSKRMPNGMPASIFETISKPYIICIGCLNLINDHSIDLWDEELSQTGECQECTHARCWRWEAGCSCPCHAEGSEDGQES
jgi:hypothetical protein